MASKAYYNEFDPGAAEWLRELIRGGHIAPGDVDERSIADVRPTDLLGYGQCHFFAGIGGWSHALRLAGWGDRRPVWTGSCPCQPYSSAGRKFNSPSLDRINPKKGYTINNVRVVLNLVNAALGDWGEQTLRAVMNRWLK